MTAFLTDYYELTMAYGYWKASLAETPAVFTLTFRSNPFQGGYTVVAGLETAVQWLEAFRFTDDELRFLRERKTDDGKAVFDAAFLDYLAGARFQCDVDAVPEGTLAFPNEPILKVRGPLWQCQWIETAMLNTLNFQSLIATKAARMVVAAKGGEVVDFGLRRAQGPDGGLSASRAAYIGGVSGTSNLQAGQRFGIPLRGTHAHSWIMAFDSETEAFRRYAEAMPEGCTLLVDTYDTLQGVRHAIEIGREMKAKGRTLGGIRLDSGDFAYLSVEARALLDAAGLGTTKIVASNELDEYLIQSLHYQGAKIDVWGVGTKLVTAGEQPAMSGVYKLAAVREDGEWKYRIKVSNQPLKTSNPGIPLVRRYFNAEGGMEGDLVYDESEKSAAQSRIVDPMVTHREKKIDPRWRHEELLVPVLVGGKRVGPAPSLVDIRMRVRAGLASLHPGHCRLENPHTYPVGLSPQLARLKVDLIRKHQEPE